MANFVLARAGLKPSDLSIIGVGATNGAVAAMRAGQIDAISIFRRIWDWFIVNADIYRHLWITLLETVLAFGIGTAFGLACGLCLALSPMAAAIFDPCIKALNAMPRVILAPIFAVWFGLGVASKVALVGEYLGSSQGVGYLILQSEGSFDINTVMAGILVLTAFALVLDAMVGVVEGRLLKWQPG